jgi:DNA-directed RNA polymerase sigma subunit (sigma70/sigma32)
MENEMTVDEALAIADDWMEMRRIIRDNGGDANHLDAEVAETLIIEMRRIREVQSKELDKLRIIEIYLDDALSLFNKR